ncbi:MAG: response regulator transcription factor [Sulfurospirillaceae bacterium]|nr:response regulator transcription factor [Sulfurospirillaceae bacterium]
MRLWRGAYRVSAKILILEDNTLLLETLEEFLSEQGYHCVLADNGKKALNKCYKEKFDLYLLDVKVPEVDGFEFLQEMRDSGDTTPAIFLTSATEKESLERGFFVGGDDYIRKPFDLMELLLRVKAVLSRSKSYADALIKIDDTYSLNTSRKRLLCNNEEMDLHLKDYELLYLLIKDRGKIVTKDMIKEELWNNDEEISEGAIRVYINNLKKIFGKKAITNSRGIGYRFEL